MRTNFQSKARIAGHPIHPMIVHFPIALFVGGVLALITYAAIADLFWYRVASVAFIAGAVSGILASIPGMVDLFAAIPRNSAARKTGLQHMALNVVAVILFGAVGIMMWQSISVYMSGAVTVLRLTVPLVLSVLGTAILAVSGTLGSKLVHKLHVGQRIDDDSNTAIVLERSGTVREDVGRTAY